MNIRMARKPLIVMATIVLTISVAVLGAPLTGVQAKANTFAAPAKATNPSTVKLATSQNRSDVNNATAIVTSGADFDGDGKTDVTVYDPTNGNWFIMQSSANTMRSQNFGFAGAIPVPGDYDGDGKADLAVYDPTCGNWFIMQSSTNTMRSQNFGFAGAIPVPGDYDGDGKTDLAVYDPTSGNWFIWKSSTGTMLEKNFGFAGAIPVPGDYDGDGKTDLAVYDPTCGNWFILQSSTGTVISKNFGFSGAVPVPGDYDGDGKADLAVYDPTCGNWFIMQSSTNAMKSLNFGFSGAKVVTGDYDGDGKTDEAVYDQNGGNWFIMQSHTGTMKSLNFGFSGAVPQPMISATTASLTTATPQYGGTLTLFISSGNQDPTGWDAMMTSDLGSGARWANPYMEWLLTGDIATYGLGPGADGSFAFNLYEGVPETKFGGEVASGWTVQLTPVLTYTWTIRQGIMFTGNTNIGMAPRELTAADVVYSEQRAMSRPGFAAAFAWLTSTQATGLFTVVWTCASFYANWTWRMGGTALGQIWAPEVVAAGPDNWQNQCGTGPFILTNYVVGSMAVYTRNPNYWGTVTINGKSYQEPFIQTLVYPIIPDIASQIAAVRTGKLDWDPKVPITYQANLASSAPQMTAAQYPVGSVDFLKYNRLTSAVVNQQAVRQALMIGTDLKTIATLEYGGGVYYSWPLAPGAAGYVPLNQLPSNIQTLWTYNPTLAKQMLTTAGYPNGFTIQIDVGPVQTQQDVANILASEWKAINVTVKINVIDAATAATEYNNVTYKDALMSNFTVVNPFTALNLARAGLAGSTYLTSDPSGMEAMYEQAAANADPISRELQLEKLQEAYQWDCGGLGFANPSVLNCYWPWLKNYYGEIDASYYNQIPMIKRIWIDQAMKTSLGH